MFYNRGDNMWFDTLKKEVDTSMIERIIYETLSKIPRITFNGGKLQKYDYEYIDPNNKELGYKKQGLMRRLKRERKDKPISYKRRMEGETPPEYPRELRPINPETGERFETISEIAGWENPELDQKGAQIIQEITMMMNADAMKAGDLLTDGQLNVFMDMSREGGENKEVAHFGSLADANLNDPNKLGTAKLTIYPKRLFDSVKHNLAKKNMKWHQLTRETQELLIQTTLLESIRHELAHATHWDSDLAYQEKDKEGNVIHESEGFDSYDMTAHELLANFGQSNWEDMYDGLDNILSHPAMLDTEGMGMTSNNEKVRNIQFEKYMRANNMKPLYSERGQWAQNLKEFADFYGGQSIRDKNKLLQYEFMYRKILGEDKNQLPRQRGREGYRLLMQRYDDSQVNVDDKHKKEKSVFLKKITGVTDTKTKKITRQSQRKNIQPKGRRKRR